MRTIDPKELLEAIPHMLSGQAAEKLPPALFYHECPCKNCKGFLVYRGTVEGLKLFECKTCFTPFMEAPVLQDLTDLDAEPVSPPLKTPKRAAPVRIPPAAQRPPVEDSPPRQTRTTNRKGPSQPATSEKALAK